MAENIVENLNPGLALQQLLEQTVFQQFSKNQNANGLEALLASLPPNVLASLAAGGISEDGITEEPEVDQVDNNMMNISANNIAALPEIKEFSFNGPKRLRIKDLPYEFSKLQEAAGREYFRCIGCRQRRDYLSEYFRKIFKVGKKFFCDFLENHFPCGKN